MRRGKPRIGQLRPRTESRSDLRLGLEVGAVTLRESWGALRLKDLILR